MSSTPTAPLDEQLRALFSTTSELSQDPYPLYERLREESPVHRYGSVVIVSQHRLGKGVFSDFRTFEPTENRSHQLPGRLDLLSAEEAALLAEYHAFEGLQMVHASGERHRRLRSAGQRAFTPRRIAQLAGTIERIANDLLDEAVAGDGPADLMRFCDWLPLLVIGEMMDVPRAEAGMIKRWTETKFALQRTPIPPENVHAVHATLVEFKEYVAGLVERHRAEPEPTSLIADLLDASAQDQLDGDELAAMYMLLLFGAHETTSNMIGNGLGALFRHPEQLELLRRDPSLIPGAVEEFLRFDAPPQFFPKRAAHDTELEGVEIAKGTIVLIAIGACNRDPRVFAAPERLDVTRTPNDHLSLGNGIHFCLGAPVARLEGKIAFETILRRFPELELAIEPGALRHTPTAATRGYESLPVDLGRDDG